MRPVVFDGCFGWLHPAEGRHAVVLCNPFGYDALCTHRGWRRLAERLASAGMPVLRFDYPGTGDSLGEESDPARVEAWIGSIGDAVRYVRQTTGAAHVSLCGLRLGATLAALAAQRIGGVDGLVLLAPALSGRNYVRELRAHRQSWLSTPAGINAAPIPDGAAYVEAFGFGIHGDDIARLAAIDLLKDTDAPARRVLLLDSKDRVRAASLVERYEAHGVAAERELFDEADRFFIEALYSEEPVQAFDSAVSWLAAAHANTAHAPGQGERDERSDTDLQIETPALVLEREQAVEHPFVFGPYFGIYCEPRSVRPDAPAVLFFNTGASHHIGDGRIFVLFARSLAALGIASLRMDLGGLGDSTPAARSVDLDMIYSNDSCTDAMAGADWLVANGYSRVVTFGVCGGAFVGLHASAQHPGIVGTFGVNLQKFIWDGAARTPGTDGLASTRVLRRSALRLDKWMRVLRGETSLVNVVRGLSQRALRTLGLRAADQINRLTGAVLVANDVHRLLHTLQAKNADVRLVYGEYDLGLDELKIQFGLQLKGLRRFSCVRASTLASLDHALFTREARDAAMAEALQWLSGRFMPAARPEPDIHRAPQASPLNRAMADAIPEAEGASCDSYPQGVRS